MARRRVYPTRRKPNNNENDRESVELTVVKPAKLVKPSVNTDRSSLVAAWDVLHRQNNALSIWKHYVCTKRENRINAGKRRRSDKRVRIYENLKVPLPFLDSDIEEGVNSSEVGNDAEISGTSRQTGQTAGNRALLIYFAKLAKADPEAPTTVVDFDFVDSLLQSGADVNVCDRYGQTIFHEASRAWHCDVALFLLEKGADINKADKYGRTAMHVAAAVDYAEMIKFLVDNGASLSACTYGECQTPIHYAAKNDADSALQELINLGADVNCRDYKQRTPLHVAAELDRSETAKLLISLDVPAGVCDENGVTAMSLMVAKMPPVAKEALEQFHSMDRANRKQYYYLNQLEPGKPGEKENILAKTPLEEAVRFKQMDLIMHPVFKRLIQVKWECFGKTGSIIQVFVQLLYCLLWTVLGITLPRTAATTYSYYDPPSKYWWRIVLESLAVSITALFICQEIAEVRNSRRQHEKWKTWRIGELNRDLKYCHPRWPEECKYIEMEIESISSQGISYFQSYWNYFDWVTYLGIICVILTRVLSVAIDNNTANELHPKVMSIALILIWLRLMKVFRAFEALGPFIVMIGHLIKDTLIFGFLYIMFYIPFICAFWINFGGDENAEKMRKAGQDSEGWRTFNNLMYSVWEITVVGNYPWDSLLVIDRTMAQILCGTYLAVSAIVCLNLFIALMSDTFQRVYDNANANAVMQKASTILSLETDMAGRRRDLFMKHIHTKCAPEEMYYDDDSVEPQSGELEKLTHQINDKVLEVEELVKTSLEERKGETSKNKESVDSLRDNLVQIIERQNYEMTAMKRELSDIKRLLTQTIVQRQVQTAAPITPPSTSNIPAPDFTRRSATSKPHKHRGKSPKKEPQDHMHQESNETIQTEHEPGRSSSLPQLDSRHAGTSSLPGIDIRRQKPPTRDIALVAPRLDQGTNGSQC
ncbi:transient receptor potential cation channel subfamily V member 5-like [Dendronephthya gigantea]|uniref:transient receptor potential cation channel subfamily V member 5-like n=1 Tax=Dendronephthya gigantea TaxID=151771 RepID=UPI00106A0AC5|nr:transient receptor potential cation channel subfamily V member 5-like [Dendronephthya gigantea]